MQPQRPEFLQVTHARGRECDRSGQFKEAGPKECLDRGGDQKPRDKDDRECDKRFGLIDSLKGHVLGDK
jgi:hypothetical protein